MIGFKGVLAGSRGIEEFHLFHGAEACKYTNFSLFWLVPIWLVPLRKCSGNQRVS